MDIVAILLAVILTALGVLHFIWALGMTWPHKDESSLARAVVGTRGIEKMPPKLASFAVAVGLFGGALWALMMREIIGYQFSQPILLLGGIALAALFSGRGVFGVLPAMERISPEQPFLRLNRYYYSPLCVLLGIGFALLVVAMPNWAWRLG